MTPDRLTRLYNPKREGPNLGFEKPNILDSTPRYIVITDGNYDFKIYKPEPPNKSSLINILLYKESTDWLAANKTLSIIPDPRNSYKNRIPVKIVPVKTIGIFRGNPYLVTEHIQGPNLNEVYNVGVGIKNIQEELAILNLTDTVFRNNLKNLSSFLNRVNTTSGLEIKLPFKAVKYSMKQNTCFITDLFSSE